MIAPSSLAAVYLGHAVFWTAFVVTRVSVRRRGTASGMDKPVVSRKARGAGLLVGLHGLGFAVLYEGLFVGVFRRFPSFFPGMPVLGLIMIVSGAILASWALLHFRSWRFRAQVDSGHRLATSGPFSLMRHPIYFALCLLALGSLLWIPNGFTAVGFGLIAIVSDLRGRAEEALLQLVFPVEYVEYKKTVPRFIPKVY